MVLRRKKSTKKYSTFKSSTLAPVVLAYISKQAWYITTLPSLHPMTTLFCLQGVSQGIYTITYGINWNRAVGYMTVGTLR